MRALLSVADGAGIAELAQELLDQGIEVFATDRTPMRWHALVSRRGPSRRWPGPTLAGASALVGGRVRTLHPAVYAGILARRHVPSDMADLAERGLASIDIVVVALRPFAPQVGRGVVPIDEAVEMIDVGGAGAPRRRCPQLRRRGRGLRSGRLRRSSSTSCASTGTSRRRSASAWPPRPSPRVAAYQGEVAAYLDHIGGVRFPEQLSLVLRKERDLPYGENPQQRGALYRETMHRARSLADAERLQGPGPPSTTSSTSMPRSAWRPTSPPRPAPSSSSATRSVWPPTTTVGRPTAAPCRATP